MTLRITAALTACAFLAACAASSPVGKDIAQAVQFTSTDLTNAAAISKAAGDVDHGVECFTWMNTNLAAIQAALSPATPTTVSGAFSALEAANVGVNVIQAGIPPALKAAAEVNCGPYVMNVAGGIAFLTKQAAGAAAAVPTGGLSNFIVNPATLAIP